MRRPARALPWLVAVATVVAAPVVRSQPQVRIRAEAGLELVDREEGGQTTIQGRLRDDLNQPLADRFVTIVLTPEDGMGGDRRQDVRTDERGAFRATFALPAGRHHVTAMFDGDATHDPVEVDRSLDPSREVVRLHLQVPQGGRLDLHEKEHEVAVWATSPAGGEGLTVLLRNEHGQPLGRATTDAAGRALFAVPSAKLGSPGPGRLVARFPGNDGRSDAQVDAPILRLRRPDIRLASQGAEGSDTVVFHGHLMDPEGALRGRAVGLFAEGDRHLATVLTDAEGRFEHRLGPQARGEEPQVVRARFDGDGDGHAGVESAPITVPAHDPPATPWLWLLLPMAASAALLAWLTRRHPARSLPRPARRARAPAGVSPGAAMTRHAERRDLAGRILDGRHGEPLPSAMATLMVPEAPPRPLTVDAGGGFHARDLPEGELTLRVEMPGYAPMEATVTVPHRGEWSHAVVRMESYRALALAAFRRVAGGILPSLRDWPTWTNREVQERARAQGAGARFDDLAGHVESVYYGPSEPTRSDVAEVEADAEAALAEVREKPTVSGTTRDVDGPSDGSL
jgi:hypothetical protein